MLCSFKAVPCLRTEWLKQESVCPGERLTAAYFICVTATDSSLTSTGLRDSQAVRNELWSQHLQHRIVPVLFPTVYPVSFAPNRSDSLRERTRAICVHACVHMRRSAHSEEGEFGSQINEAAKQRRSVSLRYFACNSQLGSNPILFPGQLSRSGPLLFPTLRWCFQKEFTY